MVLSLSIQCRVIVYLIIAQIYCYRTKIRVFRPLIQLYNGSFMDQSDGDICVDTSTKSFWIRQIE
jgi:hypothetical protein